MSINKTLMELQALRAENGHLRKQLENSMMFERVVTNALTGSCMRCETPQEAAEFAIVAADHLLKILIQAEQDALNPQPPTSGDVA